LRDLQQQRARLTRDTGAIIRRKQAILADPFSSLAPLSVAAVAADPATLQFYQAFFTAPSHRLFVATGGRELVELCASARPDLVLLDVGLPDTDAGSAVEGVCRTRPVPVILVSDGQGQALLEGAQREWVMGCLVKPLSEAGLGAAVAVALGRFSQIQSLNGQVAELRQDLEDRKVIERAKGAVMRRLRVDEEAFTRMRQLANNQNRKLVEVAQQILRAEEVFGALGGA
jgi:response regulator NasT